MTAQLVDNEVEWLDRDVIEEIIEDMQDDFGDITKGICSNGYLTIRFWYFIGLKYLYKFLH